MKKLLCLALIFSMILMIFSAMSVTIHAEIFTDYPEIQEGEVQKIKISEPGEYVCFRFTPEKNGYYTFYSIGAEEEAFGSILAMDWYELKSSMYDNAAGDGLNFIIGYEMEAGTTYILKAEFRSIYTNGTYEVVVESAQPKYSYTLSADKKATITEFSRMYHGELTIPSSLDGYPVVAIENFAFEYCSGLTSVVIPNGVVSIGQNAFAHCSNLKDIVVPDSVTQIGEYAFLDTAYYNNKKNWDGSVLYLDTFLLEAEDSLSGKYKIKPGTVVLADAAFSRCENLKEVTIPGSVKHLGDSTFSFTGLTGVVIPDGVARIGNSTFFGCTQLKNVTIPDTVTYIERYAFYGCWPMEEISIPGGVTFIGRQAFHDCRNLKKVYFDNTLGAWKKITIHEENETLLAAKIICKDGEVNSNANAPSPTKKPAPTDAVETTKAPSNSVAKATPTPVTTEGDEADEADVETPIPTSTPTDNSNANKVTPTMHSTVTDTIKNTHNGNVEAIDGDQNADNQEGNGLVIVWVALAVVLIGGLSTGAIVFFKKRTPK